MPPQSRRQRPPVDDISDATAYIGEITTAGIKVRDYAYESTLPPLPSVRRVPVQTQPRPRQPPKLKRARDMLRMEDSDGSEDEEDPTVEKTFYIDSSMVGASRGSRYRPKANATLERTLTEPVDEQPPPESWGTRPQVFKKPCRQPSLSHLSGPPNPSTPQKPARQPSQPTLSNLNTSPQSQPSLQPESQETEPWIDTPLVTPNGSLQWPVQDTSAIPPSQLESVLPQYGDDAPEGVTLSQLGFSPERSQQPQQHASSSPARSQPYSPVRRQRSTPLRSHRPTPIRSQNPSPARVRAVAGPSSATPAGTPARSRRSPQLPPPPTLRSRQVRAIPAPAPTLARHVAPAREQHKRKRGADDDDDADALLPSPAPASAPRRYELRARTVQQTAASKAAQQADAAKPKRAARAAKATKIAKAPNAAKGEPPLKKRRGDRKAEGAPAPAQVQRSRNGAAKKTR